ncbi:MAG TPA: hypothetical protein VK698_39460 [Kofleriaceae bacterium]|nr:hypothetical protein [Kofleriaceae bacterium]
MSDHGQLAHTGIGTVVIGGTAYYIGGWMILAALLLVATGTLLIRLRFRRGRTVGEK